MTQLQNENKVKSNNIRESQAITIQKVQNQRNLIKKRVDDQYRFEIEIENAYRKKKEEEIMEMESLELELIKKLHSTQLLQKSAFEELEGVLNMKATEFQ